ncbi:MAG: alpha/beta hydrolase [Candidatus Omnitrophica bacterium]|nr:alpha/beta hydrolase [Candidatus Omnitrophota bacterium]
MEHFSFWFRRIAYNNARIKSFVTVLARAFAVFLVFALWKPLPAYSISYLTSGLEAADKTAVDSGFKKQRLATSFFCLTAYTRFDEASSLLRVYIEGDGFAFSSRRFVSGNPTPSQPLVLKLAAIDPHKNTAYLARPCQYISEKEERNYHDRYWSQARFSQEVIDSMNEAIDVLKMQSGASDVLLIGYSGGAAVAVLIAAKRDDVSGLITIAGNLDHEAVNRYHKVSQLEGSLNPADYAGKISKIPQCHFAGAGDSVVPISVIEGFARAAGDSKCETVTIVDDCGHNDGWVKKWRQLLSQAF